MLLYESYPNTGYAFKNFYNKNIDNNRIFSLSYNNLLIFNSGHKNLDNNSEIFSPGKFSSFQSLRFSIKSPWLSIELEPYLIEHSDIINSPLPADGPFHYNNHSGASTVYESQGLRQSEIILHYKGAGISFGKNNHWWGPGFHSSLILSTNAPSQKTFSIGTFDEIRLKNIGFYAKVIGMPYKSLARNQLYFTGLKTQMTYYSDIILSIGMNRAYYSGEFSNNSGLNWNFSDALNLVFEPLYGQGKMDLRYTIDGTPGFDFWDELLSLNIKIIFPDDQIEFYADIASDDNRANFTDLRAHWDHTLGFQLGIIKEVDYTKNKLILATEYTSTRESNTFKSSFFRANPNALNFYAKGLYEFSTFNGRFMGAHSGSSSIDNIFMLGLVNKKFKAFLSYNREISGIKVKEFPERKSEVAISFNRLFKVNHYIFLRIEYENILNFRFKENLLSESRLINIGYSFRL